MKMIALAALAAAILVVVTSDIFSGGYNYRDSRGNSRWGTTTPYGGTVYDNRGNFGWYYSGYGQPQMAPRASAYRPFGGDQYEYRNEYRRLDGLNGGGLNSLSR